MTYPQEIMPKKEYKIINDMGQLSDENQVCLLRRIDNLGAEATQADIDKYLFQEMATKNRERINELSVNLMGGMFKEEHLAFRINPYNQVADEWVEGTKCSIEKFEDRIKSVENYTPFYFYCNDIHDREIQSPPSNEEVKTEIQNILDEGPRNRQSSDTLHKTYLRHKPTIFNYWHVQIHFVDHAGNPFPSTNLNKTHKKILALFVTEVLSKIGKTKRNINNLCSTIRPDFYLKNT